MFASGLPNVRKGSVAGILAQNPRTAVLERMAVIGANWLLLSKHSIGARSIPEVEVDSYVVGYGVLDSFLDGIANEVFITLTE